MKKTFLFAAMLAIAASCTVSEIDFIKGTTAPEITASYENNGTKTTITTDEEGVGTIWWKPADEINVFYGTLSTHYVSKNTENATTVAFGTTDIIGSTESAQENIWGLYPYNENAVCDGESVTTIIPAAQQAIAGSFDDDIFTSLAHSTSTVMTFYNVLGGIKFSLSRNDIQTISFKGNNNEDIAGKVSLSMDANGKPVAEIIEGEKTITLTPKEGTTFASNTNYYIVMLPTVLSNGFTMTFETETAIGTFEYTTKSIEIKRSVFSKKEEIDGYATFKNKNPEPEYVDLGLPSGTLWATTNVGASQEEEYGDYFAWGETLPKETYSATTYKYCKDGNNRHYTKYVRDISWGEFDGKSFLDYDDDAAYVNWGVNWITPSPTQVKELINTDNTTQEWTNKNGIYGVEFTSKSNGNKLFLPAAGERGMSMEGHCRYWTSNCNMCAMYAFLLDAYENNISCNTRGDGAGTYRTDGLSVRPVWNSPEISELVLEENNIEVPLGETKKINVLFYPENALRFIYWSVPYDYNDYLSVDENGVITGKMIGTSKVQIYGGSAKVEQNISVTAPKEPTTYYTGGWYLIAKKGDVINFHADIGSSEDGYNYEYIYLGSKKIFEYSKNNCGNNHWEHDFSYTFTEDFMGWMYFNVGWDCCISNISSTANVIGHGNFYSYGDDDNWCTNYDSWVKTPSYLFSYDHHVLTMY